MADKNSSFLADRLRQIREARGLTKTRIAQLVGVTTSAVSQYESGTINPSQDALSALANQLGVPEAFFQSSPPISIPLEACHFRRKSGVPKWEQREAVAWGELSLDFVRHLERYVDFPAVDVPRVEQRPLSRERIEEIAEDVRSEWGLGLGPLGNVVWLAEHHGVVAVELHDNSESLDAFSTWHAERPLVFLMTNKSSASRRRFDLAHELGHLILHRGLSPDEEGLEEEADAFAASFLLPRDPFEAECPRQLSWPHLIQLKRRWKSSLAAMVYRAHELGIYSEATYRRGFSQLNKRGWRTDEPEEPQMDRPALFRKAIEALESEGFGSYEEIGKRVLNLHPDDMKQLVDGPRFQAPNEIERRPRRSQAGGS